MRSIIIIFSALLTFNSYSQGITLTVNKVSLEPVFIEIQKQSSYRFIYTNEQLAGTKKVSISAQHATIQNILERCFKDQPLTYSLEENYIIVKSKEKITPEPGKFENTIKGTVDNEKGEPITGVTVALRGTKRATITQEDGSFSLQNIPPGSSLIFSSVGYETREIVVGKNTILTIHLTTSVSGLDEMVIKGYYTTSKRLNTGSVSKVTAEDIGKQPVSNPLAALQARVPGLNIVQTSGVPGGGFTVQIRGQNSLRTTAIGQIEANDPLYIIDGVPFSSTSLIQISGASGQASPLNSINPLDIESIEVLKDADATSIYGSRGSNGVILITTKKGKAGKTKVDLNVYTGAGKITQKTEFLNTQQYLQMRNEAFKNDGTTPNASVDYDLLVWDTTRFTDWQKLLIGGTAKITDADGSISGGNVNTQFLIGSGYHRESTVFPGNFADTKSSVHLNLSHTSENKKLKVGLSLSYVADNNNLLSTDLTLLSNLPPDAPTIYDQQGKLNWANGTFINPLANLLQSYKTKTNNLAGNAVLSYELLPGLEIKTNLGYTKLDLDEDHLFPLSSLNPSYGYTSGYSFVAQNDIATWIIEPQANYQKKIGSGKLNILFGSTLQENRMQSQFNYLSGFINDALIQNSGAASQYRVISANNIQYRYDALFSRINYDLQDKYLLNLTGRRDGSSRFGPGKQFANFGSLGAAWIFSNTNFVQKSFPFLSFGKLRASYGSSGSDQIGDYQYLSTYSTTGYIYQGVTGLLPTRIFNPDYAWEISKKLEVGLESGFLKDRILITADYYLNRSTNQLIGIPLPQITGFSSVQSNFPAVVQNSGMEFTINTVNFRSGKLSWKTFLNITIPRNKLVSFPGIENTFYNTYYSVGQPLNIFKGYRFGGVDPQTGVYQFIDSKGKTTLTPAYPADYVYTEKIGAEFYGGLQNSLQYKNWKLDIFLQFTKENGKNNLYVALPGTVFNQPSAVLDRWQKSGDVTNTQRFNQNLSLRQRWSDATHSSNKAISDASFIRLKNMSFSFEIPNHWNQKLKIQSSRVYMNGQNLFTLTNYENGDPETQGVLPPIKIITGGIQITL